MRAAWAKAVVGGVAGVGAALLVLLSLGLLPGMTPVGAADNGDGQRLYCGAGLVPATPDGRSNWKGGVVLEFATGGPACPDPPPSSALVALRVASTGPAWSLTRLGVLYAVLIGVGTAVAAAAIGPGWRLAVLLPPLLPLAGPTFSRFLVSTYGEPAGLAGATTLLLGVAVQASSASDLNERHSRSALLNESAVRWGVGVALTLGGGVLAATAKASFVPLLGVAVVACALTRRRGLGLVVATVVAAVAAGPVLAGVAWQDRHFAAVNTHNLVFTAVEPELGPAALGLPPASAASSGRAYYPDGVPDPTVAADPAATRSAAYRALAAHPLVTAELLGRGLSATLGAPLTYLPSAPVGPGSVAPPLGTTVGEQGAHRDQLLAWLAGLPVPWLPAAVTAAGLLVGVLARRRPAARVGALAAVAALGLVATAVLGDGFFEIAKHVWLAAYLLAAAAIATVLALVSGGRFAAPRRERRAG